MRQAEPTDFIDQDKRYKVYRIDFYSLTEFEAYLASDPKVNTLVFPTQKSKYMPAQFAGAPLEEAIRYCHGGYSEGLDLFVRLKRELEFANTGTENFRRSVPSVVGSRPHVPNFIAGTPKTMWRLDRAKERKFVDIYINLAYSGETTPEQIRNRGILTMNLISLYEQSRIGVNLYAFEASWMNNEIFIADIRLKAPGESLNVGKCYYPLCGREFVRRLLGRVKESMPFRQKWGIGYGSVLPEDLVRKCMKIGAGRILIQSPIEMGLVGDSIYQDADRFFSHLDLKDEVRVPKYMDYKRSRDEQRQGKGRGGNTELRAWKPE